MVPAVAGFPLGPLKYLGVSTFMQTLILLAIFAYMCLSIVSVFENRFHTVCLFPGKSIWTWCRFPWLCAHYVIVIVLLIPLQFFIPDQQVAVRNAFKMLPCLPQEIYNSPIFVLTEDYTYHICAALFYLVGLVIEGVIFASCLIWSSFKSLRAKTISLKTFQMQKTFFIALMLTCLPQEIYDSPIFVLAEDYTYHFCAAFFISASNIFQGGFFAFFLVWSSFKSLRSKSISLKTFQMQKKFFIALIIQMLLPLTFYIIPILYIAASVVFKYHNQAITNLSFTVASCHGLVATMAMLVLHKPYREAVLNMLWKKNGRSQDASQNNINRKHEQRRNTISPLNF
ncbi:hypothetical protein CAEBREN_24538 [Caenorhabditis brenneri]|uniref:Uncharacterized protein n=1 Tax=Caenorhabditis brenneri TaxID=135651 RepID=G0MU76_CAEBE|nr:hypothetical protein CAEBREN_24538 [Caenorhabditis brenneri]